MQQEFRRTRSGAALMLCIVLLGALVLILGLMLEVSYLNFSRFVAQSSSDLASKSALVALYKSDSGPLDQSRVDDSKQIGADIFNRNTNRSDASIQDFNFGRYTQQGSSFQPINSPVQFRNITAVRHNFTLNYQPILGSLIATDDIDLRPTSVAVAGKTRVVLCVDASRSMNYNGFPGSQFPAGASTIHESPRPGSRWFALLDCLDNFFFLSEGVLSDSPIGLATFGGGITEGGGKKLIPPEPPATEPTKVKVQSPLDLDLGRLEFPCGEFGQRKGEILGRLHSFSQYEALGFGTSLFDGLHKAIDELNSAPTPGKRIVILIADGNQTPSLNRPDPLGAALQAANQEITVLTIGYSVGNPKTLEQIAKLTGGKFFAVTNPNELDQAFQAITRFLSVRLAQ